MLTTYFFEIIFKFFGYSKYLKYFWVSPWCFGTGSSLFTRKSKEKKNEMLDKIVSALGSISIKAKHLFIFHYFFIKKGHYIEEILTWSFNEVFTKLCLYICLLNNVYTIGVYYKFSIFGLLVKFRHMVWSSGHEYLVIGFLFIRLSYLIPSIHIKYDLSCHIFC